MVIKCDEYERQTGYCATSDGIRGRQLAVAAPERRPRSRQGGEYHHVPFIYRTCITTTSAAHRSSSLTGVNASKQALDSVLKNPRRDATLLFEVKVEAIK